MRERGDRDDGTTTRILLLRHAETAAPDCFHGAESDVGLGERGQRQAHAAAAYLATLRPDAVFSSAMLRARQTAGPIASACGLELQVIEALHERRMGALSGRPRAEGWAIYEDEKRCWMAGDLGATHDGAETFVEVRDRVIPEFEGLTDRETGRTVVLVVHGVVIRIALTTLLPDLSPADFDRIAIEFVAINDIERGPDGWRAVELNRAVPGV